MIKHEIQIKPYFHVLDINHDHQPYESKIDYWKMLIGDVCRTMVCSKYKKQIEHKYVHFEYTKDLHRKMKMHILFSDAVDSFSYEPIVDDIWIYDTGHVTVPSYYFWKKYGNGILPNVNLDSNEYSGPELDWGNYIVFSPLLRSENGHNYNYTRYFSIEFNNNIIDKLFDRYGDSLLVTTDQPDKITNDSVTKIISDNLYDMLYIVGHSSTFLGGETGFTHFASLCKIPKIIGIYSQNAYSKNYYASLGIHCWHQSFERWARPYSEMGQLKDEPADDYPLYNDDYTECKLYTLYNGGLKLHELDDILDNQIVL